MYTFDRLIIKLKFVWLNDETTMLYDVLVRIKKRLCEPISPGKLKIDRYLKRPKMNRI